MAPLAAIVPMLCLLLMLGGGLSLNAAAPQVSAPPLNRNVLAGSSHTFQISATGTAPLRYQWRFNGSVLSGATNSSLLLTAVSTDAAGLYSVVITNFEGAVTSAVARLTVRTTNDAVYPAPDLGWSYLYGGSGVGNT